MVPLSALSGVALLGSSSRWVGRSCIVPLSQRREVILPRSSRPNATRRRSSSSELWGGNVGSTLVPGEINIENAQGTLKEIDTDQLRSTIANIRNLIGYSTYDVSLYLIEDDDMMEANRESRGVDKPTDILSFQFHAAKEPGILEPPEFDIPDYYNLGDILVDVPYVIRGCEEDKAMLLDDEYEYEDDRGVSGAMSTEFNPEKRIHMLLVHGMLHLVGYDHETDKDYDVMVAKEEEMLKQLGLAP